MDTAVQVFNETVAERANLKNMAYHKKNGVATSKLGNKRLTNKEIEEKHGEVKTYTMQRFMTFNEFKAMPKDLQIEYVNTLQDKYDIGIKHISQHLFIIGDEGLRSHLKINGILKDCNPDKARGKTGLDQFLLDIQIQKDKERFADVPVSKEPEPVKEKPVQYTPDWFKSLDKDGMVRFVNEVIGKYRISIETISVELFHMSRSWLWNLLKTNDAIDNILKLQIHSPILIKVNKAKFVEDIKNGTFKFEGGETAMPMSVVPKTDIQKLVPVTEEQKKIAKTPIPFTETECLKAEDPMCYHDISMHASYIRMGLDLDEFNALAVLFKDKRVKVTIDISVV